MSEGEDVPPGGGGGGEPWIFFEHPTWSWVGHMRFVVTIACSQVSLLASKNNIHG